MQSFNKICRDIKSLKIQGATNVAKSAVIAYSLSPSEKNKKILFSLRPTEPALFNALNNMKRMSKAEVMHHFDNSQNKINISIKNLIKNNSKIYTHCHSSTVTHALIYAKENGKKFSVYNTETRPHLQGRMTAKELSRNNIPVTNFVDSGMHEAIKSVDLVLLGADAILKNGVINKIGSEAIAEIAHVHKKPVYIVADSWKYFPKNVKIEERDFQEVWKNAPRKIKVRNPAFEKISKLYVSKIVSELGVLSYNQFLKAF